MNYIQNVGAADCAQGTHFDCGENSMLIQISDMLMKDKRLYTTPYFPVPKYNFKEIHQFEFLDVSENDPLAEEFGITDEQAKELVRLLQHALDNRMNVVVHCFAGVCRSGAVAVVGEMMGFSLVEGFRIPNTMVKSKMMKVLGWTYDEVK